jgi:hypothetical protein
MTPRAAILLAALAPAVPAPGATQPGGPVQAPFVQATPPAAPLPAQPAPPQGPGPDAWLARPVVDLVGLDKVSGRATALTGRVGQELQFGTLSVVARACVVRPPDVAQDAAAFLEITDKRPGPVPFRAWMLVSAPALSIYQHPVYDIRLVGCRAGP